MIHVSQLFRWRQQLCAAAPAAPVFSPVAIAPGPGTVAALSMMQPAIEIEFATGARMRLMGPVDASTVKAMVIYTLIETAKLNDVDPQAWLADVLARLPDHPAKQIGDLLLELALARMRRRSCLIPARSSASVLPRGRHRMRTPHTVGIVGADPEFRPLELAKY